MARLLRAFLLVMAVLFFTLPAHAQLKPEALVIPVYFGSAEKYFSLIQVTDIIYDSS